MGLWVYFTFRYTGRGRRVTTLVAVSILAMVGLSVLTAVLGELAWPNHSVELTNLVTGTSAVLVQALTIVSVFALVDETIQGNQYLFREALAHAGGILVFGFTPFVAGLYQEPTAVLAMVAVSSGLFLVAIHRYSLFDTLPVARVAGRDRVINEIAAPVMVVDPGGTVQDLNTAAERCFGVTAAAAVGRPLESIVHGPTEPAIIAEVGEPIPLRTPEGCTLTVSADRVTDSRDRLIPAPPSSAAETQQATACRAILTGDVPRPRPFFCIARLHH
jgi:PAS domain-containing protein